MSQIQKIRHVIYEEVEKFMKCDFKYNGYFVMYYYNRHEDSKRIIETVHFKRIKEKLTKPLKWLDKFFKIL